MVAAKAYTLRKVASEPNCKHWAECLNLGQLQMLLQYSKPLKTQRRYKAKTQL
jgi:hypothetical protein